MKRIYKILSIILVALVTGAWVIKDTANPVDIYTGSNTAPTISAASNGVVTLGPATSDSSQFVNYGTLWATSGSHFSSLADGSSFYSGKGGMITVVDKTTPETCVFACVLNLAETAGSCVVVADVGGSNCSSSFGQATKISCGYSASSIRCANNRGAIDVGVFSTSMN